jgi:uncharacterized RDD family membrane protein YckC
MEQLAQAIAARVVNLVVEAIDIDALVKRVDVEAIVESVDVDRIVEQVDIDAIVHRVDIDAIVQRVDIDAIVQRVDINAIVQRVDINAIVSNMDIDSLVEKTELGAIIARSTTGVFTEVLDVIRAQGVGLDDFCARWTNRILRRSDLPTRPGETESSGPRAHGSGGGIEVVAGPTPPELTVERQGQYAGAVSRLAAFAADIGAAWGVYVGAAALVSFAVQLLTGHPYDLAKHPLAAALVLTGWAFAYFAYQWAVAGRTIGMAVLGIRVVRATDGAPIGGRAAVVRTITLPLSIIVFFLGLVGILTNRERRGWHDHFAGTAVVYAWDARAARLRWLAERGPAHVSEPSAGGGTHQNADAPSEPGARESG